MRSGTLSLYIDTTSSTLYTALIEDDKILIEKNERYEKDLSTNTLYEIENMLKKTRKLPSDIDKVIVVNGPGSFTGIRIGVTIAKTLAWSLKKDIISITSLEAMAISSDTDKLKVPCIDARRGYVFAGIYNSNNEVVLENQYIKLEELLETVNRLGEYVIITNDDLKVESLSFNPNILKIFMASKDRPSLNPHAVNPVYLKRTEAEENKGINV